MFGENIQKRTDYVSKGFKVVEDSNFHPYKFIHGPPAAPSGLVSQGVGNGANLQANIILNNKADPLAKKQDFFYSIDTGIVPKALPMEMGTGQGGAHKNKLWHATKNKTGQFMQP